MGRFYYGVGGRKFKRVVSGIKPLYWESDDQSQMLLRLSQEKRSNEEQKID